MDAAPAPAADSSPALTDLDEAHARWLATLLELPDAAYAEPSLLPDWTRAHVVAHVANHGLGVRRAIDSYQGGPPLPIYDSQEARDAAIEAVARRAPAQLRDLSEYAVRECIGALSTIRPEQAEETVARTPGGPAIPLGALLKMRLREVWIHLADLDAGVGPADWPRSFAQALVRRAAADHGLTAYGASSVLKDGVTVAGAPAALAWWLIGRGDEDDLTVSPAGTPLPDLGTWR